MLRLTQRTSDMDSYPLIIKFFISIVLINGSPNLKLKIINHEKKIVYMCNNLEYYHFCDFSREPDFGLNLILSHPKKFEKFSFRTIWQDEKKNLSIRIDLDSHLVLKDKSTLKNRGTGFRQIKRINKMINKKSSKIILASMDSSIYFIPLKKSLFSKKSYCKNHIGLQCEPINGDSLNLFALLRFRYSFKAEEKIKEYSFFYLRSDTIKFKIE